MKGVIFDLDGTLVDSAPDIHAAANALLRAMGYQPLSFETVRGFIGNGIPKLVQRVMRVSDIEFTDKRHIKLTEQFEILYSRNPAARTVLYPGVLEMLNSFKAQGFSMGVCTNKNHGLTEQVLEAVGIADFFQSVIGGDSLAVRKPDAAPLYACVQELGVTDVIYVGDSEVDAETAAAAKVPFLLYTEGYRKGPVADIRFDHAFDHFDAVEGLVAKAFKGSKAA